MAAGVTWKPKRKAGAFAGGDLAAGEVGLDTATGVWYYSVDGSTVTALTATAAQGAKADTALQTVMFTPAIASVTTRSLANADAGKEIICTYASGMTHTIGDFLAVGECVLIKGTAAVSTPLQLAAASTTINGVTATNRAGDAILLIKRASAVFDSYLMRGNQSISDLDLASNAVTAAKIATDAVTTAKIQNDAVTYAKIQNVSATSRILGRRTAGAGDPEECTLSQILDFIVSAAQGDILYRGASGWARLGAGTAGQFFKTNGTGANPAWAAAGKVAQFVSASTSSEISSATTIPHDDTIPQNTEGVEIVTASITPTSASSNLLIQFDCPVCATSSWDRIAAALFVDSTADALAVTSALAGNATPDNPKISLLVVISAGSTSARTYKVRMGASASTVYVNRVESGSIFSTLPACYLTITEYLP